MKICKIKMIKRVSGYVCNNIYPAGYNSADINVIAYDEAVLPDGDSTGYCIGLVADDFAFTDDMVEVTSGDADTFIDARATLIADTDLRDNFSSQRKQGIIDAGIV